MQGLRSLRCSDYGLEQGGMAVGFHGHRDERHQQQQPHVRDLQEGDIVRDDVVGWESCGQRRRPGRRDVHGPSAAVVLEQRHQSDSLSHWRWSR